MEDRRFPARRNSLTHASFYISGASRLGQSQGVLPPLPPSAKSLGSQGPTAAPVLFPRESSPAIDGLQDSSSLCSPFLPLALCRGLASPFPPPYIKTEETLTLDLLTTSAQRSRHTSGTLMVARRGLWTAALQGKEKSAEPAEEQEGGPRGWVRALQGSSPEGTCESSPPSPLPSGAQLGPGPAAGRVGSRSRNAGRSGRAAGGGGKEARGSGSRCAPALRPLRGRPALTGSCGARGAARRGGGEAGRRGAPTVGAGRGLQSPRCAARPRRPPYMKTRLGPGPAPARHRPLHSLPSPPAELAAARPCVFLTQDREGGWSRAGRSEGTNRV